VAGAAVTAFGAAIWGAGMMLTVLGGAVGLLLSPIGLIVAAVVAAGVAFVKWTETGQAACTYLAESFGKLWSWVNKVFAGIVEAMKAGDFALAAEIMWAAVQVAWAKGIGWIRATWADLRFFLVDMWAKASFAILDTLNYLWAGIVEGFWAAADGVVDSWKWAEKSLAKGIAYVLAKIQGLDPDEVMVNVEEDYGRQASQRKKERDARNAADARYMAIENARRQVVDAENARRDKATADAQKALADATNRLSNALAKTPKESPKPGTPEYYLPHGHEGGGENSGGRTPGVALTATYSAAAAQISGYYGKGPEQEMADGIKQLVGLGRNQYQALQEFLAGWRVA
jgi:hypothetical protein